MIHRSVRRSLVAACIAAAGITAFSTASAGGAHAPQHGGLFVAGQQADFELVATRTTLQLYVSDHGKPKDLTGASAKLTLLAGVIRQDVVLQPVDGRLEASGTFNIAPGTQVVAVVMAGGKTLGTARFKVK